MTVADAGKCRMYVKNFGEFFLNQIEYAGTILLSHTQGMSQEKLEAVVALLRELFGLGAIWGQEIAFLKAHAVASLQKPMGGFLVYAIVAAIVNALFPAACAAEEEPGFAGVAAGTAEGGNE